MRVTHGICIISVALGVAACAVPAPVVTACPPIKPYTTEQQQQAAGELLRLPPDSMVGAMIIDYGAERARLRACAKAP